MLILVLGLVLLTHLRPFQAALSQSIQASPYVPICAACLTAAPSGTVCCAVLLMLGRRRRQLVCFWLQQAACVFLQKQQTAE